MDNKIILLFIAFFSVGFFSPMGAMDTDKDPYRLGPIEIEEPLTEADHTDVQKLVHLKNKPWPSYDPFQSDRIAIAKAIRCGHDATQFLDGACANNDYYLIKDLLEHGADVNKFWVSGPIIFALKSKPIVELFVEHGASKNSRSRLHNRSLVHAACEGEYPSELLEYYLQGSELSVNHANSKNETPLHCWAQYPLGVIPSICHLPNACKKFDILNRQGSKLNFKSRDSKGNTALSILLQKRARYANVSNRLTYWLSHDASMAAAYDMLIEKVRTAMGPEPVAQPVPQDQTDQEDAENSCPICLENLDADECPQVFPCNHTFHGACIQEWINVNPSCPLCRTRMDN